MKETQKEQTKKKPSGIHDSANDLTFVWWPCSETMFGFPFSLLLGTWNLRFHQRLNNVRRDTNGTKLFWWGGGWWCILLAAYFEAGGLRSLCDYEEVMGVLESRALGSFLWVSLRKAGRWGLYVWSNLRHWGSQLAHEFKMHVLVVMPRPFQPAFGGGGGGCKLLWFWTLNLFAPQWTFFLITQCCTWFWTFHWWSRPCGLSTLQLQTHTWVAGRSRKGFVSQKCQMPWSKDNQNSNPKSRGMQYTLLLGTVAERDIILVLFLCRDGTHKLPPCTDRHPSINLRQQDRWRAKCKLQNHSLLCWANCRLWPKNMPFVLIRLIYSIRSVQNTTQRFQAQMKITSEFSHWTLMFQNDSSLVIFVQFDSNVKASRFDWFKIPLALHSFICFFFPVPEPWALLVKLCCGHKVLGLVQNWGVELRQDEDTTSYTCLQQFVSVEDSTTRDGCRNENCFCFLSKSHSHNNLESRIGLTDLSQLTSPDTENGKSLIVKPALKQTRPLNMQYVCHFRR